MKRYFCYQGNDKDCGFASLKMLLAVTHKNEGYLRLKKTDKRDNYSFADLISIASDYGLSLTAYRYSKEEEVSIKAPFLALLDQNHLVLITSINSFAVTMSDPSFGIVVLKRGEFDRRWSGDTLEVKSSVAVEYVKDKVRIQKRSSKLFAFMFSIASLASLLIGLFFVKDNSYIFIPIILLSLFIVIELVEKWYIIKQINLFDERFIPLYFYDSTRIDKRGLEEYSEFKKMYFTFDNKILSSILLSVVIIVTLIVNNPSNAVAILGILFLNIAFRILFKEKDEAKALEISTSENKLFASNNSSSFDVLKISKMSNKFAFSLTIRKCIFSFIILLISFLMMIVSHEISVNFILFHFGIFYLLNNQFDNLVGFVDIKKEYEKSKARFLDKCNL